jgi:hypothetical protein
LAGDTVKYKLSEIPGNFLNYIVFGVVEGLCVVSQEFIDCTGVRAVNIWLLEKGELCLEFVDYQFLDVWVRTGLLREKLVARES